MLLLCACSLRHCASTAVRSAPALLRRMWSGCSADGSTARLALQHWFGASRANGAMPNDQAMHVWKTRAVMRVWVRWRRRAGMAIAFYGSVLYRAFWSLVVRAGCSARSASTRISGHLSYRTRVGSCGCVGCQRVGGALDLRIGWPTIACVFAIVALSMPGVA